MTLKASILCLLCITQANLWQSGLTFLNRLLRTPRKTHKSLPPPTLPRRGPPEHKPALALIQGCAK